MPVAQPRMLRPDDHVRGTVVRSCETQDIIRSGAAEHNGGVACEEYLGAVHGRQSLIHRLDGQRVDPVLGFFDEIDSFQVVKIGRKRQSEEIFSTPPVTSCFSQVLTGKLTSSSGKFASVDLRGPSLNAGRQRPSLGCASA